MKHSCKENWYARLNVTIPSRNTNDNLIELTSDQLKKFWEMCRHRLFSCPYRREKFFYKGIPLIFSLLALIISITGNETLKEFLGFPKNPPKATELAQPIRVTVEPSAATMPSIIPTPAVQQSVLPVPRPAKSSETNK